MPQLYAIYMKLTSNRMIGKLKVKGWKNTLCKHSSKESRSTYSNIKQTPEQDNDHIQKSTLYNDKSVNSPRDIAILNVCAPIDRTAKICEAKIDVMERRNRQIHNSILLYRHPIELNRKLARTKTDSTPSTFQIQHLINIYRTLPNNNRIHFFPECPQNIYQDRVMCPKTSFNKFKIIEIVQTVFFDHNRIKLESIAER